MADFRIFHTSHQVLKKEIKNWIWILLQLYMIMISITKLFLLSNLLDGTIEFEEQIIENPASKRGKCVGRFVPYPMNCWKRDHFRTRIPDIIFFFMGRLAVRTLNYELCQHCGVGDCHIWIQYDKCISVSTNKTGIGSLVLGIASGKLFEVNLHAKLPAVKATTWISRAQSTRSYLHFDHYEKISFENFSHVWSSL